MKLFVLLLMTGLIVSEVAAMLHLGGMLGIGWTLLWIVISALLGVVLARRAGLATLLKIHRKLQAEVLPTTELLDMGLILLGAFFLMLPGFVTDGLGVLLALPPARWMIRGLLVILLTTLLGRTMTSDPGRHGEEVIEIHREE